MKSGDFHGLKTKLLENDLFQIECLAEAGPRIVRLIPKWTGENLFAEVPDMTAEASSGIYHYRGGHRFWYSPESLAVNYRPDDEGVTVKSIQKGIRLDGGKDRQTGLQKSITIQTSASQPFIVVKHKVENHGRHSVRLAPWAITMMRPEGVAVLPQQFSNLDSDGLLPNRRFALWPYSRWNDPRLNLGDDFILIRSDETSNPFKLGYFNPHGWLGYVHQDVVFLKRYGVRSDEAYPDFGCNAEVYVNQRMIELESLGPILQLEPGEHVVHTETWEIYKESEFPRAIFTEKTIQELFTRG